MASSPKNLPLDREARARKRTEEANKALSDAQIEQKRIDANTLRLRALRLAKEEADRAAAAANPAPVKKSRARAAAKPKASAPPKSIPVEELTAANDD